MEPKSRNRTLAVFLLLVVATAVATFLRDPYNYLLPRLPYEDGRDIFGYFYNHRHPGSILRFYNGYVALGPNLVGFLALRLPVTWVPYVLALFPLLLSSLTFALLGCPQYRGWIANDALRILAAISLALIPVSNYHFIATTAYSIWILLFLLILLSLAPPPRTPLRALGRGTVMAILICSIPVSIALLPVYVVLLFSQPRNPGWRRLYYAALTGVIVLYQLFGVETEAAAMPAPAKTLELTILLTLERVVFGTLFGDQATRLLRLATAPEAVFMAGLFVTLLLVTLIVAHRDRVDRLRWAQLMTLTYLVVALTALYIVSRAPTLEILSGNEAFRYFWVPRLCFILLVFVTIDLLWGRRLRRLPSPVLAVMLAVYWAYLFHLNVQNNDRYLTRPFEGRQLVSFVADISRQEATATGVVHARLERGAWSIEVQRPFNEQGRE